MEEPIEERMFRLSQLLFQKVIMTVLDVQSSIYTLSSIDSALRMGAHAD